MKEHLYRGKRADNGEWVYGNLYEAKISGCYILTPRIKVRKKDGIVLGDYFDIYEVQPETICEFTGLTDKNGNKIFEGDILLKPKWYVAYANGENESYGMACGWYLVRDDFESWSVLTKEDEYEVVGNIYDNPES